jgi:hypothetical protein
VPCPVTNNPSSQKTKTNNPSKDQTASRGPLVENRRLQIHPRRDRTISYTAAHHDFLSPPWRLHATLINPSTRAAAASTTSRSPPPVPTAARSRPQLSSPAIYRYHSPPPSGSHLGIGIGFQGIFMWIYRWSPSFQWRDSGFSLLLNL